MYPSVAVLQHLVLKTTTISPTGAGKVLTNSNQH
jgi:hypothetical protein